MSRRDLIHDTVRNALIKDGWTITADPYTIEYEEIMVFADLAADRLLALYRDDDKIAVEIKSFVGRSWVHDLEVALGQYTVYRSLLEVTAPERKLYLAISEDAYTKLFQQQAVQLLIQRHEVALLIVNIESEEIVTWIN